MTKSLTLHTAGGRIRCAQCQAMAKSTRRQCLRPATKGKRVCKLHGGLSTGPRTEQGRQRCADVRTVYGGETTSRRKERSLASASLAVLESIGHSLGIISGTRTRGTKPHRMGDVEPELQALYKKIILGHVKHSL